MRVATFPVTKNKQTATCNMKMAGGDVGLVSRGNGCRDELVRENDKQWTKQGRSKYGCTTDPLLASEDRDRHRRQELGGGSVTHGGRDHDGREDVTSGSVEPNDCGIGRREELVNGGDAHGTEQERRGERC